MLTIAAARRACAFSVFVRVEIVQVFAIAINAHPSMYSRPIPGFRLLLPHAIEHHPAPMGMLVNLLGKYREFVGSQAPRLVH